MSYSLDQRAPDASGAGAMPQGYGFNDGGVSQRPPGGDAMPQQQQPENYQASYNAQNGGWGASPPQSTPQYGGGAPQQPASASAMHPTDVFHAMVAHPHGQAILQNLGWTPPAQQQPAPSQGFSMPSMPKVQQQAGASFTPPSLGAGGVSAPSFSQQQPQQPRLPNPGLPSRAIGQG